MEDYVSYIKTQSRDFRMLQERYKIAITLLAISALLNAALLGAWLWERVQ